MAIRGGTTVKAIAALLVALALFGCTKPLPADRLAYAGEWIGPATYLLITGDGRVDYKRVRGSSTTSIKAPIVEFNGSDFTVGAGPLTTTFVVSVAPHADGNVWKMTVDGVELTKSQPASAT